MLKSWKKWWSVQILDIIFRRRPEMVLNDYTKNVRENEKSKLSIGFSLRN